MTRSTRNGPAARTNKGHPRRQARRDRAAERAAVHVYDPERCKPGCRAATEGSAKP